MGKRSSSYVVRKAKQLRALASPARLRIVEDLSAHSPSSIREVAKRIDRLPGSLHYHFKELKRAGLILTAGTRLSGKRTETLYRLVAPQLRVDPDQRSRAYKEALKASSRTLLRLAERNVATAIDDGDLTLDGAHRTLATRRYVARISPDGLTKLNHAIERVHRVLVSQEDADGGNTYAVTIALAPLIDPQPVVTKYDASPRK